MVRSPILSLILYAEAKYSVSELGAGPPIELPIGREVQFSVGEMLANYFNATQYYSPREDIDVILVKVGEGYGPLRLSRVGSRRGRP